MYSNDGALHFSTLKYIKQSPLHYAHAVARTDFDSPSMRIGRAVHALVLQGIEADVYEGERRGKAWTEFKESRGSVSDVLNSAEWAKVQRMRDAVFADQFAREVLDTCTVREEELSWTRDGHPCKGRLDARSPSRSALCDLKTAKTVEPFAFMRDARRASYHGQLPWYDNGQGKGIGNWSDQFVIAVENIEPFPVQVFQLSPLCIVQGWDETCEWMARFDECFRSGKFAQGYRPGIVEWDAELVFASADDEEEVEE